MLRLRVFFSIVLLSAAPAVAQGLPRAQPHEAGFSDDALDRLRTALHQYVEEGRLPGGVTWVAREGSVVFEEAFGFQNLEARVPMSTGSVFRIASQSKALTSVAIMILQEEGKLLLSDPLSRYLPEFVDMTGTMEAWSRGYYLKSWIRSAAQGTTEAACTLIIAAVT